MLLAGTLSPQSICAVLHSPNDLRRRLFVSVLTCGMQTQSADNYIRYEQPFIATARAQSFSERQIEPASVQ